MKAVREGGSLAHHVAQLRITCRGRGHGIVNVFTLFLILSLISLWLPEKLNPVLFAISLLIIVIRLVSGNARNDRVGAFQHLLLVYALWIN